MEENINSFILLLSPLQKKFTPKNIQFCSKETTDLIEEHPQLIKKIHNNAKDTFMENYQIMVLQKTKLSKIDNSPIYSLYTSILYLLCPSYSISSFIKQNDFVEEFVRLLISHLETDVPTKKIIRQLGFRSNHLIEQIKNANFQSYDVVFYVAMVLDINIIILTHIGKTEIYFCEDKIDFCKPFILLYKNIQNIYNPVFYDNKSILIYYEHDIIKELIDTFKTKIINLNTYINKN